MMKECCDERGGSDDPEHDESPLIGHSERPHNLEPTAGRAGSGPIDFDLTRTRDAGLIHCSVWLCTSRAAVFE
jgi:hypothetical protein